MAKKRQIEEESSSESEAAASAQASGDEEAPQEPPKKKATKPLPAGYVCKACGAEGQHAIYDCPSKVSKKSAPEGAEASSEGKKDLSEEELARRRAKKEAKKEAKQQARAAPKFPGFVAGLPFDTTRESLFAFIKEHMEAPLTLEPRDIVILTFPDNPKKCKGIAYVNFRDEQEFERFLLLNNTSIGGMTLSVQKSNLPLRTREEAVKAKGPRCYRCGGKHDPKECTNPRICYRCKSTEHISGQCPLRKQASS